MQTVADRLSLSVESGSVAVGPAVCTMQANVGFQSTTPRENSGGLAQPQITLRRPVLSRYADPPSNADPRGSRRHEETRESLMSTHMVEGWTGSVAASLAATRKTIPEDLELPIRDPHASVQVTNPPSSASAYLT